VWAPTASNWAVASTIVDYRHTKRDDLTQEVVEEVINGGEVRPGITSVSACFARGENVQRFIYELDRDGGDGGRCVFWDVEGSFCGEFQGLLSAISGMTACDLEQLNSDTFTASQCELDESSYGATEALRKEFIQTNAHGFNVNISASEPVFQPTNFIEMKTTIRDEKKAASDPSGGPHHLRYVPFSMRSSYGAIQSLDVSIDTILNPIYNMQLDVSAVTNTSMVFEDVKTISFSDAFDLTLAFRQMLNCTKEVQPRSFQH